MRKCFLRGIKRAECNSKQHRIIRRFPTNSNMAMSVLATTPPPVSQPTPPTTFPPQLTPCPRPPPYPCTFPRRTLLTPHPSNLPHPRRPITHPRTYRRFRPVVGDGATPVMHRFRFSWVHRFRFTVSVSIRRCVLLVSPNAAVAMSRYEG